MKKILACIAFLLISTLSLQAQIKGSGILYFQDAITLTPNEQYGSEWAYVIDDSTLYRWSRDAVAWVKYTTGEVYAIATAADTSAISEPYEGDIAYVDPALLFLRSELAWLQFSGGSGGSTEQADGLTILGAGTGGDPFRVNTDSLHLPTLTLDIQSPVFLPPCATSDNLLFTGAIRDDSIRAGDDITGFLSEDHEAVFSIVSAFEQDGGAIFEMFGGSVAPGVYAPAIYYKGRLKWASNITVEATPGDTTTSLLQDSILIHSVCGVEVNRDTIPVSLGGGGGAADGVATAGAHDTGNEELDFTVASPGSNFSVDVSEMHTDSEAREYIVTDTISLHNGEYVELGYLYNANYSFSASVKITISGTGQSYSATYDVNTTFLKYASWVAIYPQEASGQTASQLIYLDVRNISVPGASTGLEFRIRNNTSVTLTGGYAIRYTKPQAWTADGSRGTGASASFATPMSFGSQNLGGTQSFGINKVPGSQYGLDVGGSVNSTGYSISGAAFTPVDQTSVSVAAGGGNYTNAFTYVRAFQNNFSLYVTDYTTGSNVAGGQYHFVSGYNEGNGSTYVLTPSAGSGQAATPRFQVQVTISGSITVNIRIVNLTGVALTLFARLYDHTGSATVTPLATTGTGASTSLPQWLNSPMNVWKGNVGIGSITTPSYPLDLGGATGGQRIPVGTTAQQPTGANGVIRYNLDESLYQGYRSAAYTFFPYMDASKANLVANNYKWNVDQSVAGLGGYRMTYNSSNDEMELIPSAVSTRGTLYETISTAFTPLSGAWVRINGLLSSALSGYSATDSTLTFSGSTTHWARVDYSGSVKLAPSGSGTYNLRFTLFSNTTELAPSESRVQVVTDAAETWIQPISGHYITQILSGTVISLKTRGDAAANPEINNLQISVTAL